MYKDITTFPSQFSKVGKGLLKDVPCPDKLSLWEQLIGIKSRQGEQCAQKESAVSVNDGRKKSGAKEVEKDSESSDTPTGVLQ